MTFILAGDTTSQQNGDLLITTDKGSKVALIFVQPEGRTVEIAEAMVSWLNAAYSPSMTDMMVSPEDLEVWLQTNGLDQ